MMNKDWAYRRGDIYYADLNPVCGSEQGGLRPVVVIQNNIGNKHAPTLIVAMVTTKTTKKANLPTHYLIRNNDAFAEPSIVLLEQIRTIDKKRIKSYLGKTTEKELLGIDKALVRSLSLAYLIKIHDTR
nr:type II toxin-antitoxin system PemK/MazF family toxin [[Clostridium] innocuum]